jgi:hypothetical protein
MNYVNGSESAKILKSITCFSKIPFYLVSADDKSAIENLNYIDAIYNKPFSKLNAEKVLLQSISLD